MEIVNILAAAAAAFGFGAIWYSVMAKPWMAASKVPVVNGKPRNASNPIIYIGGFAMMVLVSGMMRHMFALSGIATVDKGIVAGAGLGLFIVLPWVTTYYLFADRAKLIWIDGVYCVVGCTLIGTVLTLF